MAHVERVRAVMGDDVLPLASDVDQGSPSTVAIIR
jgi:hypothetical protein